jgi:hypothetical protein
VFEWLGQLTDIRKARGKRFRLETIPRIIVIAKICREDKLSAIADWAKNRQEQKVKVVAIEKTQVTTIQHVSSDSGAYGV